MEDFKELINIKESFESRIEFLNSYMSMNYYCGDFYGDFKIKLDEFKCIIYNKKIYSKDLKFLHELEVEQGVKFREITKNGVDCLLCNEYQIAKEFNNYFVDLPNGTFKLIDLKFEFEIYKCSMIDFIYDHVYNSGVVECYFKFYSDKNEISNNGVYIFKPSDIKDNILTYIYTCYDYSKKILVNVELKDLYSFLLKNYKVKIFV